MSGVLNKITIDKIDITNPAACLKAVQKAEPDYLFHLAALSSVGQSFAMGEETFRINVLGTYNILNALRGRRIKKILLVSSADIYGPVTAKEMPLGPDHLFNPISPYGQSKAAAEYLGRIYCERYDLPIVFIRAFNHTGPRQNLNFAIPSFCRKIAEAERSGGKGAVVTVGNLNVRRDISDVRDIVRGYRLLAEKGKAGEAYHLCAGKAYVMADLLKKLMTQAIMPIKVKKDPGLFRKADIPILRGSHSKTTKETGWKPQIKIETTLKDTLDYWRTQN